MQTFMVDLTDNNLSLPELHNKAVFYFVPPPATGVMDVYLQHFVEALKASEQVPWKIVYISTTGVYGDCEGRWIDENEPLKPDADRAKRRLDAEKQLQHYANESGCQLVILRVAGIYGPGKLPLSRLEKQLPVVRPEESPFTNRIHADDLVSICLAAMQKGENGSIFNVSDGQPGKMADYFTRIANKAGLPEPPLISLAEASEQLSAGMMSYMRESRRLDNRLLLTKLGIELAYPDLETGLEHCFLCDDF